ncbi:hypothetical protein ABFS83_08G190200 [Erythranthe nasuta]
MAAAVSSSSLNKVGYTLSLMMVCLFVIIITGPAEVESAAITCSAVVTRITSCIGYVQRGGEVTPACCDSLKSLNDEAKTTADLQAACRCLTALIPSVSPNPSLINSLPDKCGIPFPYRYTPSLDCSKLTR